MHRRISASKYKNRSGHTDQCRQSRIRPASVILEFGEDDLSGCPWRERPEDSHDRNETANAKAQHEYLDLGKLLDKGCVDYDRHEDNGDRKEGAVPSFQ